jgi:hypothetical protein
MSTAAGFHNRQSEFCVICASVPATTVEHIPAKLFFDKPLPDNLITVPSCEPCNRGSQHEDEYLRAFLMSIQHPVSTPAMENVRYRTIRHLHRKDHPGLKIAMQRASTFRQTGFTPDGRPVIELFAKPYRDRLGKVLEKYARGLHFWSTGRTLPLNAPPSIERIFCLETRPAEYWDSLIAAAEYARAGTVTMIGSKAEFRYSFRAIRSGDALSVMVLDFYGVFPYVVLWMKPGTDFARPLALPF